MLILKCYNFYISNTKNKWLSKYIVKNVGGTNMCLLITMLLLTVSSLLNAEISLNIGEIFVVDRKDDLSLKTFGTKTVEKGKNIYIPDILQYESEIDIRRRTVVSDNADMISIRGLSGNRLLLNLNGRSLNASGVVGGYYTDWSTIPLDNIEKIQIIKGGSDVRYGNNALGGVINIITKKPKDKFEFGIFSSYGFSDDIDYITNTRLYASKKFNIFGYSVSGSYSKSDEFLWNNDYEAKNISGNFYLDMLYDGELYLGLQYTNTTRGFIRNNRKSTNPTNPLFYEKINPDYPLASGEIIAPGFGNQNIFQPGPGSYWDKEKTYLDLGYKQPIGDYFAEFRIYKNIENRFEKNYSSHLTSNTYTDGLLVLNRKVESDRSWGSYFNIKREFEKHNLESGVEYKYLGYGDIKVFYYDKTYNNNQTYTGGPQSQEGKVMAYYLKDEYKFKDNLSIIAGLRYDDYKVNPLNGSAVKKLNDSYLSRSLSLLYKFSDDTKISFSGYIKSRTPQMPEVYWWSNGLTAGTNDLKSEKNHALELNLSHKIFENHNINLSAFNYNIDDYIMFRFGINPGNKRAVYNIDNVHIYGAGIDFKGSYRKVNYYANITFQKSKKGYDMYDQAKLTDELNYMPKFKSNIGANININEKNLVSFNWRFVDNQKSIENYMNFGTVYSLLYTIKSYNTFDMEYNFKYSDNLSLSAYGQNIFNESYYERFGYPMPGRVIGFTAKLSF